MVSPLAPHREDDSEAFFLSLVVPTYNVEPYIGHFLASVFGQSSPLQDFEVILVDDGSTDGTAAIIEEWRALFPKHVRYVFQENKGPSAARNTGISVARGNWIGFPDPDDFLNVHYFREMLKEIRRPHKRPLLAAVSNFILYYEGDNRIADRHPLKYRFSNGRVELNTNDLGDHVFSHVNTAWIRKSAIDESSTRFDERVKPSFEDGHFVNRLLLSQKNQSISFVSSARYYYRKRAAKTSILDTQNVKRTWFLDQIEYGYIGLFECARDLRNGKIPRFIRRHVFYSIFWQFKHLINHSERAAFLTDAERARFLELVGNVMDCVEVEDITSFELAGIEEKHKRGLLALYKNSDLREAKVHVERLCSSPSGIQFSYYSGGDHEDDVSVSVNGKPRKLSDVSVVRDYFFDRVFCRKTLFWVDLEENDKVEFSVNGVAATIVKGARSLGSNVNIKKVTDALRPAGPASADEETFMLRSYVRAMKGKYGGCSVLIDRSHKADDNAEHLYRHMMKTNRAENAYFVLSEESPDWERLEAEGFQLLSHGSKDHIAAHMNSKYVISSHYDLGVWWPVSQRDFSDIASFEFVFLQHGVTKDDQSGWFNTRAPKFISTATQAEYEDISGESGNYRFSKREVALCGFPRHDLLLKRSIEVSARDILIIPTWRQELTDTENRTDKLLFGKVEGFEETPYAKNWMNLVNSDDLRRIADENGLRVVFCPHPNFSIYLDDLAFADHVKVVNPMDHDSYMDILPNARIGITDYSSAIMDLAYIDRPILYFQFDRDIFYQGEHVYRQGYFSYERDGFGPVVTELDDLCAQLEKALRGDEPKEFSERRMAAFPFRDGQCCERVCALLEGA